MGGMRVCDGGGGGGGERMRSDKSTIVAHVLIR